MIVYPEYLVEINGRTWSQYSEKDYTAGPAGTAYQYAMDDWKAIAHMGGTIKMRTVKVSEWEPINVE
jgi:hypothetical protein